MKKESDGVVGGGEGGRRKGLEKQREAALTGPKTPSEKSPCGRLEPTSAQASSKAAA